MKFLKTYGKQKTKLSAWVSIQDRKKAFDSTSASDTDISTHRISKPTRIRAAKKVALPLSSEDEESVFTCPQPPSRRRKPSTANLGYARKRKKRLSVSSDEENFVPQIRNTKSGNHKKTRRQKSRLYSDKTTSDQIPHHSSDVNIRPPMSCQNSSGSKGKYLVTRENNSTNQEQTVQQHKNLRKDSVCLSNAGRFVTRRRCAVSSMPRALKLNSSDEFSSSRIIRPPRRMCHPVSLESSADSSVNAALLLSFVSIPRQDVSLNESNEHSLGPCSRKPIFCSTPSAAPLGKRLKLKHFNPTSSPPSISVSCIGPVSTSQADLCSSEQLNSPPHASPSESSVGKHVATGELQKHSQSHLEEFRDKTSSSPCEEGLTQGSHEMPSVITISSDVSSYFTSATGDLEWLNDVLKERCLTQLCTVRLERLSLIQLFSETTYSSCLGDLDSVCSSNGKEHLFSVNGSKNSQNNKSSEPSTSPELSLTSSILKPVESSKSSLQHSVLVNNSQCTESDEGKESEHKSFLDHLSTPKNSYTDLADVSVEDKLEELSIMVKNKCLSRKCSVELKKLSPSSIKQRLTPELKHSQNDLSKARLVQKNSSTVCHDESQSENDAELTKKVKEKCLDGKSLVKVRKMSVTEIQQKLQKSIDLSNRNTSKLAEEHPEPKSNCTMSSPKESRRRKRTSTSSNDRAVSDKDVLKTNRLSNNRKRSLAPKEKKRRTSTDRPGTMRKACISGLSVSRWRHRDAFTNGPGHKGGMKVVDSSINELLPSQHRQPLEVTNFSKNFSTPAKHGNLNLYSLLTELTPNTHTWSRLKAALSIHRKVILTPKTPGSQTSSKLALTDLSQDLFATPFRTPLPKRLRAQLMTHESQLVFEDDELSDAEKVYAECGQQGPLTWLDCLQPQRMKRCVKIGEGTFGEVFSTMSTECDEETVALKVIPVEGSEKVNGEKQKTFGEILHEIIISKELSSLKEKENNLTCGFIGLRNLHCVKGCYPPEFLKAWDKYDHQKHSENDRPDFFKNEQLFIILEFEFGGSDLENCNGTLSSLNVAKSILHQVTAALAVAEQELHFEHRDLHWGNVLVKTTKQKITEFTLNGNVQSLETKGVLVRIIDYSLSRLEIDELTVSCDISHDEELFMGQGDYQFDIYRLMKQENGNDWSSYHPHSNVLWLHYLCSKLLDMKYRGMGGKRKKDMRSELTSFYDNVLQFSSATEVLQKSPLFQ